MTQPPSPDSLRLIRNRDLVRTAWKNGGGTTAEAAVHPDGAGFDRFGWRLSFADIAADGSFSTFEGIDRTLIVVEGAGLLLDVDGTTHRLEGVGSRLAFSGSVGASGRLIDGPLRDLNVMTRAGVHHHEVRDLSGRSVVAAGPAGTVSIVVALDAELTVETRDSSHRLGRLDLLLIAGREDRHPLHVEGTALLVAITTA